jgi:glycosyltransferase involved in cell wall biosynthesis
MLTTDLKLNKNITFIPTTATPEKYYEDSKIFILTSDYEGFPLTLMEAISCGCYPIVNNIPEVSTFFNKYKNNIIFQDNITASKIIQEVLHEPDLKVINFYRQKIISYQKQFLKKYTHYCLN